MADNPTEIYKDEPVLHDLRDSSSRMGGRGGSHNAAYSVFNGINILGGIPNLPPYNDNQGMTFFTKPFLNLTYHNAKGIRKLSYLVDKDPLSMGCAIKCSLSPGPGEHGTPHGPENAEVDSVRSLLVDDENCFIPLLGNTCISLSGWPDFAPDIYTSKEGYSHEQVSWIDGKPLIHNSYDLSATFVNMDGDPLYTLMSAWLEYSTRVAEGSMAPYPISLVENRIDYQTRIYRIILDKTRTYIQKIFATGVSFPNSHPTGAVANYNAENKLSTDNNQLSFNFKCTGFIENDPMLIWSFNRSVVTYKPNMGDAMRETTMRKLTATAITTTTRDGSNTIMINDKVLFNYNAYPRISDGNELEWWVDLSVYNRMKEIMEETK